MGNNDFPAGTDSEGAGDRRVHGGRYARFRSVEKNYKKIKNSACAENLFLKQFAIAMSKFNQNGEIQVSADSTQARDGKKQYCAPVLTILGSVNDITRGITLITTPDLVALSV